MKALHLNYKIAHSLEELSQDIDALQDENLFLTRKYFKVLEHSAPNNMCCHYITVYQDKKIVGISIAQFLDLNSLASFGERDRCLKTIFRNFVFKNFSSHVLFIGNNMVSGQNAFWIDHTVDKTKAISCIKDATLDIIQHYKSKKTKIHIVSFKDFEQEYLPYFNDPFFKDCFCFSTQPNMIFTIRENWNTEQDYIDSLTKKYRDQYKRARKKADGIVKQKLNLKTIKLYEEQIFDLYFHVAKNAPFNTFFLQKNHFEVFKKQLQNNFLLYGYFIDNKLIGFNTLLKNGTTMETYFLGYDDVFQKEKMLYLNMLYDMIAYSINKGFKKIIFGRTALEIKSSIGAQPLTMFGFVKHNNKIINKFMPKLFSYFDPKVTWVERNPFK